MITRAHKYASPAPSLPPSLLTPPPQKKKLCKVHKVLFFFLFKTPIRITRVFICSTPKSQRAKKKPSFLLQLQNQFFFFKNAHLSVGVKCKCAIPGCFFFFSFLQPTLISQRINHTQAKVLHTLCCLSFFFFLSRGCFGDPSSKPFFFSFFFFLSSSFSKQLLFSYQCSTPCLHLNFV